MKNKISAYCFLIIVICFFINCSFVKQNKVEITIENNSKQVIDTASILIQDYKFSTYNIKPNTIFTKIIDVDSITLNSHDVMIRAYFLNSEKRNYKNGFYYTDLGGYLNNRYTITVDNDLNVKIR